MEKMIFLYVSIMSITLFMLMFIDKSRAKKHKYRISEKTLWTIALFGGACGGLIGMYLFHHKTKHFSFIIGFPVLSIIQIYIIIKLVLLM